MKKRFYPIFLLIPFLGFIPPAQYPIGKWMDQGRKQKSLHILQRTTVFSGPSSEGPKVEEEIWFRRPGLFRKKSVLGDRSVDVLVGPQTAGRFFQGKFDVVPPAEAMGPLGIFYAYGDEKRVLSLLRQIGIATESTRWILDRQQVQLEIGEAQGRRVRFYKGDWTPSGAEWGSRSYRYTFPLNSPGRIPYPDLVEVFEGGKLVEKTEVQSVEVDVAIPDSIFDVKRLSETVKKK